MKITHPQSFGSIKFYRNLIPLVEKHPHQWRKISNMLNNLRRDLRCWAHIDKNTQRAEAEKSVKQALRDTKLPAHVRTELVTGITAEFGFVFAEA